MPPKPAASSASRSRPLQERRSGFTRIPPLLHQPEARGLQIKGQGLGGQIQFIVDEHICFGELVHQWGAADFALLLFHFDTVIGVGIAALNHDRLQYHDPDHYTNYISILLEI